MPPNTAQANAPSNNQGSPDSPSSQNPVTNGPKKRIRTVSLLPIGFFPLSFTLGFIFPEIL